MFFSVGFSKQLCWNVLVCIDRASFLYRFRTTTYVTTLRAACQNSLILVLIYSFKAIRKSFFRLGPLEGMYQRPFQFHSQSYWRSSVSEWPSHVAAETGEGVSMDISVWSNTRDEFGGNFWKCYCFSYCATCNFWEVRSTWATESVSESL